MNASTVLPVIGSSSTLVPPELEYIQSGPSRIERGDVLLIKPPFFTPFTPPLGISILKSYLGAAGYRVRCVDFNTEMRLWDTHHVYFKELQKLEHVSINDGYSKLWWIMNAHLLAFMNGATAAQCEELLYTVCPLYDIECNGAVAATLQRVVEQFFSSLELAAERIELDGISVVGTSTYTTSLASSLFLLRLFKRRKPSLTTVMGGGVFADDLALGSENLEVLLREYPFVNHVVLGEGEGLFLDLLEGKLAHKRIIHLGDHQGKNLVTDEVPPPDFSDFNLDQYYHLTIEGARSCPFQCSFCSETIQWGKYRKKGMESFADQVMGLAEKHGNQSFFLADSLMNPYIVAFASELLDRKTGILYDGYLRADKVAADYERVAAWAKSGLYRVRLGIESASNRVLKAMDKRTTPQVISEAIRYLAASGVRTTTYWIVGFPGESEEDFQETMTFIREHRKYIYELEAHPFYYYPYGQVGSRFYQSNSLYPESVTRLTRFRVWDVVGKEPDRYERYHRLSRISQLAADLGLINIYSMEARYEAEERWFKLHPLAHNVYESTFSPRPEFSGLPVTGAPSSDKPQAFPAHCYAARTHGILDPGLLARAGSELIKRTELDLRDCFAADTQQQLAITMFSLDDENPDTRQKMAADLIAGMRREQKQMALAIAHGKTYSDLLMCAGAEVVDHRGLAILWQELVCIYIQLSREAAPKLSANAFTFSELLAGDGYADLAKRCAIYEGGTMSGGSQERLAYDTGTIEGVGKRTWELLAEYGLPREFFILHEILKAAVAYPAIFSSTYVTLNERLLDQRLADLPGPFTSLRALTGLAESCVSSNATPHGIVASLREVLREAKPAQFQQLLPSDVLINLGPAAEDPWIDDPNWEPGEFLDSQPFHTVPGLEITPRLNEQGQLCFRLEAMSGTPFADRAGEIAETIARAAPQTIQRAASLMEVQSFWTTEFRRPCRACDRHYRSAPLVPHQRWEMMEGAPAQSKQSADDLMFLAASCLTLSRVLAERDPILFIAREDTPGNEVPLRFPVDWKMSFAALMNVIQRRYGLAREHGYGSWALAHEAVQKFHGLNLNDVALGGVAYLSSALNPGDVPRLRLASLFPGSIDSLDFVFLRISDLEWKFCFRSDVVSPDFAERIVALHGRVLAEAGKPTEIGEIGAHHAASAASIDSEVFHF